MNLPNINEARKRTKNPVNINYLADEKNNIVLKAKHYFLRTYGC